MSLRVEGSSREFNIDFEKLQEENKRAPCDDKKQPEEDESRRMTTMTRTRSQMELHNNF